MSQQSYALHQKGEVSHLGDSHELHGKIPVHSDIVGPCQLTLATLAFAQDCRSCKQRQSCHANCPPHSALSPCEKCKKLVLTLNCAREACNESIMMHVLVSNSQ